MRGRTPGEHVRDDGGRVVEVVDDGDVEPGRPASPWRLPWLLLAALVIAGLLSALLLFGSGCGVPSASRQAVRPDTARLFDSPFHLLPPSSPAGVAAFSAGSPLSTFPTHHKRRPQTLPTT